MASARMTQLFQDVKKTLPQKSMKSHKVRFERIQRASSSNGQSSHHLKMTIKLMVKMKVVMTLIA
ncbi:hypothetical protein KY289_023068 [Solanum tuberosum]|nr:hypothetical protein KY289_023068 [Solanum tuberosum]